MSGADLITRRSLIAGGVALGAIAATGAAATSGFATPAITRYALPITASPVGAKLRIAVISDIHLSEPWTPLSHFDRIVAASNALDPDLVLLAGDYGGESVLGAERVSMAEFGFRSRRLAARIGVYAVLGNHDWTDDMAALRAGRPPRAQRGLEAAGIPVLRNESIRIETPDRPAFWLAGLDSQEPASRAFGGGPPVNIDRALAPTMHDDDPVIMLAHEPDIFAMHHPRPALTIAGHMHGGQVALGDWRPGALPSRYGSRFLYGHIREAGRDLIVSGGIGYSRVPVRIGCPPEIVLIEASL
jgi:predicted MPP superfamily phosphohydrolase